MEQPGPAPRRAGIDYGTPFWAYSDDEDLADLRGDLAAPSSWDARDQERPHSLGLSDDEQAEADFREWWAGPTQADDQPPSRDAVQRLLDRPNLSWGACRRATGTAASIGEWDLAGSAALRALRVAQERGFD